MASGGGQSLTHEPRDGSPQEYGNPPTGSTMQMPSHYHNAASGGGLRGDPRAGPSGSDIAWEHVDGSMRPQGHQMASAHLRDSQGDYTMGGQTKPEYAIGRTMASGHPPVASMISGYSEPRSVDLLHAVSSIYIPDMPPAPGMSWQDNSAATSSTSGSTFSTPTDNPRRHHLPPPNSGDEWTTSLSYGGQSGELRGSAVDSDNLNLSYDFSGSSTHTLYPPMFGW